MKRSQGQWGRRALLAAVLGLLAVGVIAAISDWHELRIAAAKAHWYIAVLAALVAGISNLSTSYSFALAAQLFGVAIPRRYLLEIGFVSNALNQVVSPAGAAGFALRLLIARWRGASTVDMMTASLAHSELTNLLLFAMVPVGLLYLLTEGVVSRQESVLIGLFVVLLAAVFCGSLLVTINGKARHRFLAGTEALLRRLFRRDVHGFFRNLEVSVSRGLSSTTHHPMLSIGIVALAALDWAAGVAVLGLCFYAFDIPVPLGVLITGFAAGMTVGLVSMIPGGLGVQDATMVGIFSLSGAPLEGTVLALVLFRGAYYLVPFAVSLPLYARLIRPPDK